MRPAIRTERNGDTVRTYGGVERKRARRYKLSIDQPGDDSSIIYECDDGTKEHVMKDMASAMRMSMLVEWGDPKASICSVDERGRVIDRLVSRRDLWKKEMGEPVAGLGPGSLSGEIEMAIYEAECRRFVRVAFMRDERKRLERATGDGAGKRMARRI